MFNILVYLLAIQKTAKGIHYLCKNSSFYSDHLLADKIQDGLDDFMDDIQEICYLGHNEDAPQPSSVLKAATAIVPVLTDDIDEDFNLLNNLIVSCITEIQSLSEKPYSLGDFDLLGRIGSDLQQKHGFIFRRLT